METARMSCRSLPPLPTSPTHTCMHVHTHTGVHTRTQAHTHREARLSTRVDKIIISPAGVVQWCPGIRVNLVGILALLKMFHDGRYVTIDSRTVQRILINPVERSSAEQFGSRNEKPCSHSSYKLIEHHTPIDYQFPSPRITQERTTNLTLEEIAVK